MLIKITTDDATEAVLRREAAQAETTIDGLIFKAVMLLIRLRRAERDGGRIYITKVTDDGVDTFERVQVTS